jgi:hydroxymethylbilane synthase
LLPAAGQGALGIECREHDTQIMALLMTLNDEGTQRCVTAERALCRYLGGGCQVPVAAYAKMHHDVLSLQGLVANQDGTRILRAMREGHSRDAERIGVRVAEELQQQGADKILQTFL